tara:strand:- start:243 stop:824 length:582 start_codon:yes stop_codon:yes gene_type:complete
MKILFLLFIFFFVVNCNKPKSVLICGDHVCINKAEAEQFFEENLTIEVKIINKKVKKNINLVEVNLAENKDGDKKISLATKSKTNENLKTLSNNEILKIKKKIKNKKKEKKLAKKVFKNKDKVINQKEIKLKENSKESKISSKNRKSVINNVNKKNTNVVDVCKMLKKCSIDEISKYLLEQSKKKGFPDITSK